MAQLSQQALIAYIEDKIKQNGNEDINGVYLQDVLVKIARSYSEEPMLCDTAMDQASIDKLLMLDPTDGLVKVYQEEPASSGQAVIYEIEFLNVTAANASNEPSITLEDGSTGETETFLHSDWNATPPVSTIIEAQNLATYIENNVNDWSANWVQSTSKLTITSDNLPGIFSDHSISLNNLANTNFKGLQDGKANIPKYSKNAAIGFCGGVEEINSVKYAIVKSGKINQGISVKNNPLDLSHLNTISAGNYNGVPKFIMVGADDGKVRSANSELDNFGMIGVAISELPDSSQELPVFIKETFIFFKHLNNKIMDKSNMIKAFRKGKTAEFSEMVWNGMGTDKNGWTLEKGTSLSSAKSDEPSLYEKTIEQAKGFEKDGKKQDALAKYEAANEIKHTKAVEKKILSLTKSIDKEVKAQEIEEFVSSGDSAKEAGDLEGALEFYENALALSSTAKIKKLISDLKKQIKEAK